jgi:hypothetical protein
MYGRTRTVPQFEERLIEVESEIAQLRAEQVVLVNELDRAQAPQTDGSRSLVEWVQAHLVFAARTIGHHRYISLQLAAGSCTFDRAVASTKLAAAGVEPSGVLDSFSLDLHNVSRLTAHRQRVTWQDEHQAFEDRYFTSQPSLDQSHYRFWGRLPGVQGRTFEKAMFERADELETNSPGVPSTRSQRQADAVVAMAQDSLDRDRGDANSAAEGHVTVFVDARRDDAVETSAEIAFGPRVGPNALETMLCTGRIRIVGMDGAIPVLTSRAARAIPPAVRDAVCHRDGGCTIDGCRSLYRLQPHHVLPWSQGGTHEVANLTTLCWYHHHVAIHGSGFSIDPESPPLRRRLIRRVVRSGTDPP